MSAIMESKPFKPLDRLLVNRDKVEGDLRKENVSIMIKALETLRDVHRTDPLYSLSFGKIFDGDWDDIVCRPLIATLNCLGNAEDSSCNVPKVIQLALHRANGPELLNPCALMTMVVKECGWKTLTADAQAWWTQRKSLWTKLTKRTTPHVQCIRAVSAWLTLMYRLNPKQQQHNNLIFLHSYGTQLMPQGVHGFTCQRTYDQANLAALAAHLQRKPVVHKKLISVVGTLPRHWEGCALPWDTGDQEEQVAFVLDDIKEGHEGVSVTPPASRPCTPGNTQWQLKMDVLQLISSMEAALLRMRHLAAEIFKGEDNVPGTTSTM